MAKIFYTERDIEDMVKRGERSLVVGDDVVLTDLAYESAKKLGVELIQPHENPPAAPVRPYLNKPAGASTAPQSAAVSPRVAAIKERVKSAVKERMGDAIDEAMLDRIIERVAADLGLK